MCVYVYVCACVYVCVCIYIYICMPDTKNMVMNHGIYSTIGYSGNFKTTQVYKHITTGTQNSKFGASPTVSVVKNWW